MLKSDTEKKDTSNETILYEIGFHILPVVSVETVSDIFTDLKTGIEKIGGRMVSEEEPKKITLAYEMEISKGGKKQKYSEGYFGWIKFEGDPRSAEKVDEFFKENENILRYLIIKTVREDTFYHAADEIGAGPDDEEKLDKADGNVEEKKEKEEDGHHKIDEGELDESLSRMTS